MAFPKHLNTYKYRGGHDKWVYDTLKELVEKPEPEPPEPPEPEEFDIIITVEDTNNTPINEATVTINNTTKTTDNNGTCTFTLTPDTYTITVTKTGYNNRTKTITITEDTTTTITLTEIQDALVLTYDASINQTFNTYNSTPFTFTGELVIDYGDDTTETISENKQLEHTYSSTGEYTITISGNLTGLNERCFYECEGITNAIIPNTVTDMENFCFRSCSNLATVTLPDNITAIGNDKGFGGEGCFAENGLTTITIPENVTILKSGSFYRCTNLNSIIFKPSTPPAIAGLGIGVFNNIPVTCKIYVPTGSLSAYTSAGGYPSSETYEYIEYNPNE